MTDKLHHIITLTGDLGSGKSKTGKLICTELGFEYISTGDIQRKLAAELQLTTLEMNKLAETDPSIDERIDSIFINLKDTDRQLVVDSRMAWHFLPGSFKILLKADIDITTERVLNDKIRKSETKEEPEYNVLKNSLIARKNSETRRFIEKYNADGTKLSNFDLVIETSFISAEDVAEIAIINFEAWKNNFPYPKCWFSPHQLLPLPVLPQNEASSGIPDIIESNGLYYIYAGDDIVKEALASQKKYLPGLLLNGENVVRKSIDANELASKYRPSLCEEWEKQFGFHFYKKPLL